MSADQPVKRFPDRVPLLARPGNDPDRAALYRALSKRWMQGPPITWRGAQHTRSDLLLSEILGVSRQNVWVWGAEKRVEGKTPAPWWVVMYLADQLGLAVLVEPTGCSIVEGLPRGS